METIQEVFDDLILKHSELEKIKLDIRNYQKQFRKRIQELKENLQKDEDVIKKYLSENNLPGLKKKKDGCNYIVTSVEKPQACKTGMKEKKIQELFCKHQIDTGSKIFQDVIEVLYTSKNNDVIEKKIKIQKLNE
jgi:DNA-binding ferritin-like protein (Dps family)